MDKPSCCVESLSWLAELFIRLCLAAGVGIANSDVMPTFVRIGFYSEISVLLRRTVGVYPLVNCGFWSVLF